MCFNFKDVVSSVQPSLKKAIRWLTFKTSLSRLNWQQTSFCWIWTRPYGPALAAFRSREGVRIFHDRCFRCLLCFSEACWHFWSILEMLCLNVTHGCIPGKRQALGTVWECKSVIIAWHAYLKACCVLRGIKQLRRDILYVCACMCWQILRHLYRKK